MLYKANDKFETPGQIWMRYRNHPLPFPMSEGGSSNKKNQQIYMWGGAGERLGDGTTVSIEPVYNSRCYDFGFVGDIMWIFGTSWNVDKGGVQDDRILVFANDYVYYATPNEDHYSYLNQTYDEIRELRKEDFIGVYSYLDYIVFVYLDNFNGSTGVATFKFKHYDKYDKRFIDSPLETVIIDGLQPPYTGTSDHVWKLAVSEELVTIGYESINSSTDNDFVNSITTIDLVKNTLSDNPANYVVQEWKYVLENN